MQFRTESLKPRVFVTILVALSLLMGPLVLAAKATSLDEIVKKAAQEGRLVAQMSEPLRASTAEADRRMTAGLKKTFGVDIKVTIHRARSYPAATAQVLSEIKAGSSPSWDIMYQTDVTGMSLYQENSIARLDWLKLFNWVNKGDLTYNGKGLIAQTRFVFPAYNTNIVKGGDIPKGWKGILHPKWKRKIGTTPYQDMWAQLADPQQWGEEGVLTYLKGLAGQKPKLGGFPTLRRMITSGEIAIAAVYPSNYLAADNEIGAPVAAVSVTPEIAFIDVVFVPKGARHANAATLLAAWLLSADGQRFFEEFYKGSSMFRPGTSAARHAKDRKIAVPVFEWQLKNSIRLQKQYEKILVRN